MLDEIMKMTTRLATRRSFLEKTERAAAALAMALIGAPAAKAGLKCDNPNLYEYACCCLCSPQNFNCTSGNCTGCGGASSHPCCWQWPCPYCNPSTCACTWWTCLECFDNLTDCTNDFNNNGNLCTGVICSRAIRTGTCPPCAPPCA